MERLKDSTSDASKHEINEPENLKIGEVIGDEILDMISGASFAKATWTKRIRTIDDQI